MPALLSPDHLPDLARDREIAVLEIGYGAPATSPPTVIPGARRVDWQALLWDDTARQLATPEQLSSRLGALGIAPGTALVVYGDPVQFGAYAAWALEVAGYPRVGLLDGGLEAWVADGRPLEQVRLELLPGPIDASGWAHQAPAAEDAARIDRGTVAGVLGDPGWVLLDVRSDEEFSGERVSPPEFPVDHGATVGGHLPGAVHVPFRDLLDDAGRFRSPVELAERLADAGVRPGQRIVTYCRLGHRAALAWFALRHVLGLPHVQVYEGSWTEWGSLVGAPVER